MAGPCLSSGGPGFKHPKTLHELGRESLVFTGRSKMSLARKMFFKALSQNAIPASAFFKLPPGRVVEIGVQIEL